MSLVNVSPPSDSVEDVEYTVGAKTTSVTGKIFRVGKIVHVNIRIQSSGATSTDTLLTIKNAKDRPSETTYLMGGLLAGSSQIAVGIYALTSAGVMTEAYTNTATTTMVVIGTYVAASG